VKGLWLNVPDARERVAGLSERLGTPMHVAPAAHAAFGDAIVSYHPVAWPEGPVFREGDLFACASGWFVFRGRLGDLAGFARAFRAAVQAGRPGDAARELDAGAFVVLLAVGDEPWVVTDAFGLHPHYTTEEGPFRRLAPAPAFVAGGRPRHEAATRMLESVNMTFGNLTGFAGVERLEPGAVHGRAGRVAFFDYARPGAPPEDVPDLLRRAQGFFRGTKRILALSGGLDSRLVLATGEFEHGYTFGPRDTGDRPVARRFRDCLPDYDDFSLLDLEYREPVRAAGRELLDGICPRPFLELLPAYRRVLERAGDGAFFFDAYLGDVLSRGTYLTHGGVRGGVAKLLPPVTLRRFDPIAHLRRRYPRLPPDLVPVLAAIFEEKTAGLDLDAPHRLVLFEIVWGRGSRHILNGGSILSNQYFASAQPFFFPDVFRALFATDANDTLRYRTVRRVWSRVPARFAGVRTFSGYKPTWHPDVARAVMLATRGLARKGLLRRAISYESELSRVRWS